MWGGRGGSVEVRERERWMVGKLTVYAVCIITFLFFFLVSDEGVTFCLQRIYEEGMNGQIWTKRRRRYKCFRFFFLYGYEGISYIVIRYVGR